MNSEHILECVVVSGTTGARITVAELVEASGLRPEHLAELVDEGMLPASGGTPEQWTFPVSGVMRARAARRLREQLDLDGPGIAVALLLLDRIKELEDRLTELECHLPRWSQR